MKEVLIYSKKVCPYCDRAKALLKTKGVPYKEVDVEAIEGFYEQLKAKTGMKTVPQIFVGETLVGGFTDLDAANKSGKLDQLLGE